MSLSAGTRLGAYEVLSSLGAGGMGEVYKARDTRLDRIVALKVVTGTRAADPEARQRFEQEARTIAALNHPHICTIHDVGTHPSTGPGQGSTDYLVIEFLEGETLADRLTRGPLTLEDALALAIQIGDALGAAHRVGIVHRDLKPANVMLLSASATSTADRRVPVAKLLDFGLAAHTEPASAPGLQASLLATTAPSMIATRPPSASSASSGFSGTVQYMAPEQMDGKPADHRADIFAFGCVLYEMLAGRKAFEGANAMTVIAAIMGTEPKPIEALQSAPPIVDHVLRRCLEKDPERRWQNMADVTGELRWIASQPLAAVRVASGTKGGLTTRQWVGVTLAAALLILEDGKRFLFFVGLGAPEVNGTYIGTFDDAPPVRILGTESVARYAQPGHLVAVRQGALVAYEFGSGAGTVAGEPIVLTRGIGEDATGDGAFTVSHTGVLAYRFGGRQRRQLQWVNRQGLVLGSIGEPGTDSIGSPELSPDERAIALFLRGRGGNDVGLIDLVRNLPRFITNTPPADAHPLWDPDGRHVVYVSARLEGNGPVRQAVDGTGQPAALFPNDTAGAALSWTRDRQYVLLRQGGQRPDLVAVSIDGTRTIPIAQSPADETEGQFSPDGTWVAFVSHESGRAEVYLQAFPQSAGRTQVSTAGGTQVRWSTDGREIFYIAPDGRMTAVKVSGTAAAPDVAAPVALFQTYLATGGNVIGNKAQYAVSRDGRFLLNNAIETPSTPIVVTVNWQRLLRR